MTTQKSKTTKAPEKNIRVFGNLGGNPEEFELKPKENATSFKDYDPATDSVVDRKPRTFHTASLAVNYKDDNGEKQTRWLKLIDFRGNLVKLHAAKGDRLRVQGEIRHKEYTKKDKTTGIETQLVANEIWLEHGKDEQAEEPAAE